MKKSRTKAFAWLAGTVAFSAVVASKVTVEPEITDPIMLENIEALANDWENYPAVNCYGEGCLDCPNGWKVKYIITDF